MEAEGAEPQVAVTGGVPSAAVKRFALAVLVALPLVACAPIKGQGPSCPVPTAREMIDVVNADRAAHERQPVKLDPTLNALAREWAQHMADANFLSHSPEEHRIRGSSGGPVLENIAGPVIGFCETAASLEARWMASPAHSANIINPPWNRFGGAFVLDAQGRQWAVQLFTYHPVGQSSAGSGGCSSA